MMDLTIPELVILLAAFVIAGSVVVPFIPRWAAYTIEVGIAFYFIVRMVLDGPTVSRVAWAVIAASLAAYIWRRDLRGTRSGGANPGTGTKPP